VTADREAMAGGTLPSIPTHEDFWDFSGSPGARQRLIDALTYELVGPSEDEEELFESPATRYLTGLLAPFGTGVLPSEQDVSLTAGEGDDDVGTSEAAPPISQAMTPSSIGISFLVPDTVTQILVRPSWGEYYRLRPADLEADEDAPAGFEDEHQPWEAAPEGSDSGRAPRRPRWKRRPHDEASIILVLSPSGGLQSHPIGDTEITVEHLTRRISDRLAVSVFLVNRRPESEKGRAPADRWIYQPSLGISAEDGKAIFLPRDLEPLLGQPDRDLQSNRLLYRNKREFAVGHGCAAKWEHDDGRVEAHQVGTSLIPIFELPRVEPRALPGEGLEMSVLATCRDGAHLRALLDPLVIEYASWIEKKVPLVLTLPPDLRAVAMQHLDDCQLALTRIERAIALLGTDSDALEAFCFANRAMLLQRSHSEWASIRRKSPGAGPASPNLEGRWRPFQLAFILLNLPGMIDPKSEERRVGDLLWFPTGGGKTEAYLGLTAFTVAHRRLQKLPGFRTDAGVSVLMRYTLRLLTIQQFQRAVALICACEVIRREAPDRWGDRRFTIGLWVGISATPTTHAESRRALARLQNHERQLDKNPCQLESCPWCGETLTHNDYLDNGDALRTYVYCPRAACEFSRDSKTGLPVVMVDEEIYRECPSMVISTVDKFAQMPWNGEIQALFGRVESECERCGFLTPDSDHQRAHGPEVVHPTERLAPLDLIIQDELHLISGPLGTLVGLYETAIDWLSTRREGGVEIAPKLVASTATVRRAFEQVHALFDRTLRVFPPPGLEPEDSFFATEKPVAEVPGRLYVGAMGPGKSMKTAVVRVASILLAVGSGLAERDAQTADPYLTLVMYFNSLRELGGAVRLMDDDVVSRLDHLRQRGLPRRFPPRYEELTSRVASARIPSLLRQLEQPHTAPTDNTTPAPLDGVLASNMISVGVDVQRLGLMTVIGQPKTTAEYIQATSRVGRQASAPGLVVTLYNWARPRDLSHYERFGQYHGTFYRSVEAVSATPFSSRARDRGLAGVFVAMARLVEFELDPEEAAGKFDRGDPSVILAIDALRRRAESVADAATARDLERQLATLVSEWEALTDEPLRYGWRTPDPSNLPKSEVLLRQAEGGQWGQWEAPGSLREVEENSPVYVLDLDGA
jgi:hypothetical protein